MKHLAYMQEAIIEAKKALALDEVPIGAIVVKDHHIIGRGHNTKETDQDVTHHAEINAIKEASQHLKSWHLDDCDLYVTIEPCAMCASAIIQSRIRNVYYGAKEPKTGAHVSKMMMFDQKDQPSVDVYSGIAEDVCQNLMVAYFKSKRIR